VTGGAAGLGLAYARRFVVEGARVVIADVADAAEALARLDADVTHAVRADVAIFADCRRLVDEAQRRFGRVDVLVNNAAVFATLRPTPLEAIPEAEWDRVMTVNVKGIWNCVRAVTPLMRRQGGGRIVNVASAIAHKGTAGLLHYVTSKGAVITMTRALARELGPDGITVNAVAPGLTMSDTVLANPDIAAFPARRGARLALAQARGGGRGPRGHAGLPRLGGQRLHDRADPRRRRRLGVRLAMLTRVPVIDVAPFLHGAPVEQAAVARAIGRACEDIGFFTIVGHGVDATLVRRMDEVSRAFFDLPVADKQRVRRPKPEQSRGYIGLGEENLSYGVGRDTTDLKEFFAIGPVDVPGEPYYRTAAAYPSFAPNVWPERPAELRGVYTKYYRAMEGLAAQLMRAFALALGLPEDFFRDKTDRHISGIRVINYPDQPEAPAAGQLRAGAHSDYGALTILKAETVPGGLELLNRAGNGWRSRR
jgi:NAD(P)-dependent dehydrogenase (short-subunit alcohol dehydrogenase family)